MMIGIIIQFHFCTIICIDINWGGFFLLLFCFVFFLPTVHSYLSSDAQISSLHSEISNVMFSILRIHVMPLRALAILTLLITHFKVSLLKISLKYLYWWWNYQQNLGAVRWEVVKPIYFTSCEIILFHTNKVLLLKI